MKANHLYSGSQAVSKKADTDTTIQEVVTKLKKTISAYEQKLADAKEFPTLLLHNHIVCLGHGFTVDYADGKCVSSVSDFPTQYSKRDADMLATELSKQSSELTIRSMFYLDWYREQLTQSKALLQFTESK